MLVGLYVGVSMLLLAAALPAKKKQTLQSTIKCKDVALDGIKITGGPGRSTKKVTVAANYSWGGGAKLPTYSNELRTEIISLTTC